MKPLNDIQEEIDQEWDSQANGLTDEKRQRLQIKALIYRDAFIPTLIRSIMPYNPKGVMKESDEILEWINGLNAMGKKESTDEQFWLSAWNGRKYSAIRAGNVKINIPRVFTNLIGGIQPDLLYKLFKNERGTSGFIFRVLFAQPEQFRIARPTHGYDMPIEYKELHNQHLIKLYKGLPVTDHYAQPNVCLVTQEAIKIIARWEDDKITMINNIIDIREMNVHSGILGKIKEYAYRFAGIIAVTDWTYNMKSTDSYFPSELPITEDIMKRAIKAADYFYKSAVNIYEAVDSSITAPLEVLEMATLFKMGTSVARMAEVILKDKKAKGQMHRKLAKAIKEYPKVFGAVVHNQ